MRDGILKGLYRFKASEKKDAKLRAQLFGSGTIMYEVLKAQEILEEKYGVAADVWSVTSYKRALSRWQRLRALEHAASGRESTRAVCYAMLKRCTRSIRGGIGLHEGACRNRSAQWMPRPLVALGTDGFGRSEGRAALRDFFEVDAKHIVLATLNALARDKQIDAGTLQKAIKDLGINPEKLNPAIT